MPEFVVSGRIQIDSKAGVAEVEKAKSAIGGLGEAAKKTGASAAEAARGTAGFTAEAGKAAKETAGIGKAAEISAGQMSMARRIVTANLINIGNVAVATRGNLAMMASPIPDVIYGLRMMGVGASGFGMAAGAAFLATAGTIAVVANHLATTESRTRQLDVAIKAMGSTAGVTGEQLRKMSEQAVAGTNPFGRSDAFNAALNMSYSRRLSGRMMGQVLNLGVDFAAGTGRDLAAGVDTLTKAFEKGYAGIRELDDQFGFLTASEREQIKTMAEHGRQAEMLQLAIDALNRRFRGLAREGMSSASLAADAFGQSWTKVLDALANHPYVKWLAERGAASNQVIASALTPAPEPTVAQQVAAKSKDLAEAERTLADLEQAPWWRKASSLLRKAREDVARLRKEIDDLVERGRREVDRMNADETAAEARATQAQIEASARQVEQLEETFARQREVLLAPANRRDLVQAQQAAREWIKSNAITGEGNVAEVSRLFEGGAYDKLKSAAKDAAAATRLQADAQERLAAAAGISNEAMRKAAVENRIAAASTRYLGQGTGELAAQLRRLGEAEARTQRAQWARETREQAAANDNLAAAYRSGSAAAVEAAERENAIVDVMRRTGASYVEAAAGVDRLRESRRSLAAESTLADLRNQLADAQAYTAAMGRGDRAGMRDASIAAETRRYANDNRLKSDDPQVIEFRAIQQRAYADSLARSAIATNQARDASIGYRDAMAALDELRATGLLSAQAYAEEWKRIELAKLDASKEWEDGVARGLMRIKEEARDMATSFESATVGAFRKSEDAFVQWGKTGKLAAGDLFDFIGEEALRMVYRMAVVKPFLEPLGNAFGGWMQGLFAGQANWSTTGLGEGTWGMGQIYHRGGVVGQPTETRIVPMSVFAGAPRAHQGAVIGKDEVPVIAKKGEVIGWPGQFGGVDIQIIDQRGANAPPIESSKSRGPDGREVVRMLVRAEMTRAADDGVLDQPMRRNFGVGRVPATIRG